MRRVLLACDLDSQVFGALPLALAFAARGWGVTFAIESVRALPQPLLERLTRDFSIIERSIGALPSEDVLFEHDAVGVFVTGSRLALFRHFLELSARVKMRPRPAIFCGFNGLVFEKFEEGLAWRLGYDVIGLNSPRDRDAFLDFVHDTDFAEQPAVVVGLRRKTDTPPLPLKIPQAQADIEPLDAADLPPPPDPENPREPDGPAPADESAVPPIDPATAVSDERVASEPEAAPSADASPAPRKLFVFAEQVVVPRNPRERQALVEILAKVARRSPDWDVVIKARVRPDERTFHQQTNHISKLVKDVKKRPKNLIVSYEPLEDLLVRADLFATISSTALFDAFDYGVPSIVAADFGLRNADGAHVFFASGLLAQLGELSSLDEAPIRAPNERWRERMGYGVEFSPGSLIDWLEGFDPSRAMPDCFVSHRTAVNTACGNGGRSTRVRDLWDKVEAALSEARTTETAADAAPGKPTTDARAALFGLASEIGEYLRPNGASAPAAKDLSSNGDNGANGAASPKVPALRKKEDPIATFARKIKMYRYYKRFRAFLGVPLK